MFPWNHRNKGNLAREKIITSLKAPMRAKTLPSFLIWLTNSRGTGELKKTNALETERGEGQDKSEWFFLNKTTHNFRKDKLNKQYRMKKIHHVLFIQRCSSSHVGQKHNNTAWQQNQNMREIVGGGYHPYKPWHNVRRRNIQKHHQNTNFSKQKKEHVI